MELEAQDMEFEKLYECPSGCGRSFRRKALEKHIKVCEKVFKPKDNTEAKKAPVKISEKESASKVEKQAEEPLKKEHQKIQQKKEATGPRKKEEKKIEDEMIKIDINCDLCKKGMTKAAYDRHRPICESKFKFAKKVEPAKKGAIFI